MKKLFLLPLICFFLHIDLHSQACLPQGIVFTTQSEIDSFQVTYPNCTEIGGSVGIGGSDITNLHGLDVITTIGGNLRIYDNPLLENLTGLENMRRT